MRALAITGIDTAALIPSIISGSLIRATPPSRRMSAGTRSRAMTAQAPASSAILACSGVTTSMMTPPLSISARPRLTGNVPVRRSSGAFEVMAPSYRPTGVAPREGSPWTGAGATRPVARVRPRRTSPVRSSRASDVAGSASSTQVRPGLSWIGRVVVVEQGERSVAVAAQPGPGDHLAAGEDEGIAAADRDRLRAARVGGARPVGDLEDRPRWCRRPARPCLPSRCGLPSVARRKAFCSGLHVPQHRVGVHPHRRRRHVRRRGSARRGRGS